MTGVAMRLGFTPYSADDERLLGQVPMHPGGPTRGRAGLRPGGGAEVTIGGSPEAATVAPFTAVVHDTAGGGTFEVVFPNPETLPLPTRPESGSTRLVDVGVRVLNSDARPTDGTRVCEVYLKAGASAVNPNPPSVTAGQLHLMRLSVPAGSAEVSVTRLAPSTVAVGGVLPARTQAERDAVAPVWEGLTVARTDLDQLETYFDDAWRPSGRLHACELYATTQQAPAVPSATNTVVKLDAVAHDNAGLGDLDGERIVIKAPGAYRIRGAVAYAAPNNPGQGYRRARVLVNGNAVRGCSVDANSTANLPTTVDVEVVRQLAAGDVVTLDTFQTYGAAINTAADGTFFSSLGVQQLDG